MLASEQMRYSAQIMAAIFGGPGIFYVIESFDMPDYALTGILYLVVATALAKFAEDRSKNAAEPPRDGWRTAKALLTSCLRRR
jgi:hypothetical protein